MLNVTWCAVCVSAAPNNWRIEDVPPPRAPHLGPPVLHLQNDVHPRILRQQLHRLGKRLEDVVVRERGGLEGARRRAGAAARGGKRRGLQAQAAVGARLPPQGRGAAGPGPAPDPGHGGVEGRVGGGGGGVRGGGGVAAPVQHPVPQVGAEDGQQQHVPQQEGRDVDGVGDGPAGRATKGRGRAAGRSGRRRTVMRPFRLARSTPHPRSKKGRARARPKKKPLPSCLVEATNFWEPKIHFPFCICRFGTGDDPHLKNSPGGRRVVHGPLSTKYPPTSPALPYPIQGVGEQVCQETSSTGIITEGENFATSRNPEACCYFLAGSGWFLLFPGRLRMVPLISWQAPDGSSYFLAGSGWFLLFPGRLWMVPLISWQAPDGSSYFLAGSGWFLLFPGRLRMVPLMSWWALDGSSYFLVGTFKILGNTASQCIPVTQPPHAANKHILVPSLRPVHCCTSCV